MNLMSFKHTSPVRIAAVLMLIVGGLTVTGIAFLVDPTRMVKDQIKNKLTGLEKSTTREIIAGSSPEDFMRTLSESLTSELTKDP